MTEHEPDLTPKCYGVQHWPQLHEKFRCVRYLPPIRCVIYVAFKSKMRWGCIFNLGGWVHKLTNVARQLTMKTDVAVVPFQKMRMILRFLQFNVMLGTRKDCQTLEERCHFYTCVPLWDTTRVVFLSVLCCRKLHNQLCPPIPSAAPGSPTKGTSSTSHTPSLCQQTLACRSRVSPHHTSIHSCFSFIYLIKFGFLLHVASLEPGS